MNMLTAIQLLGDFRSGSSLPVLVRASDGNEYVVKWKAGAEGPAAVAADWIGSGVADALGLPVPGMSLITVDAALGVQAADIEVREIIGKSAGLNAAVRYVPGAEVFRSAAGSALDPVLRDSVFLYDVLTLNIDRVDNNPNMLRRGAALYCIDYSSAMVLKGAVDGNRYPENALLPLLKRHPFYTEAPSGRLLDSFAFCDAGLFAGLAAQLPGEWLAGISPEEVRRRVVRTLSDLRDACRETIIRRIEILKAIPSQSPGQRLARSRRNSAAFYEQYGKNSHG